MSGEDPYSTFKAAFEVQRNEIQRLYDRVSELERVNTEVLSYVKERGSLPVLNCLNANTEGCNPGSLGSDTELKQESFNSSTSHDNSLRVLSSGERAVNIGTAGDPPSYPSTGSSLLSDLVTQHAMELNKALETLGLDPAKRSRLLDQIQLNLHTILHTQLAHDVGSVARPIEVQQPPLIQSTPLEKTMDTYTSLASSGDGTIPGGWPLSSLDALTLDKSVEFASQSRQSCAAHMSSTPLGALAPTNMEVQERRRSELMRLNQRMQNPTASTHSLRSADCTPLVCSTETNIPTTFSSSNPVTCDTHCSPSGNTPFSGSRQLNNEQEPPAAINVSFRGFTVPTVESVQSAIAHGSPSQKTAVPQNRLCPCGNRQSCPLPLIKQRRFGSDPRVARGFTLLAAVFRGRLIRQLLATNKVYDLIRTVKDTAKLALSIHVERQASFDNSSDPALSDPAASNKSSNQKSDGLSAEELVLESRLMVQLRGALKQLHDIFFNWPLSSQLELLALSRSIPQRTKRPSNRMHHAREDSLSAEPPGDGGSQRGLADSRRRWCSSATAPSKPRDNSDGQARRCSEKPGSCGSYSLTRSIDAVRQSWPQNQSSERRKKTQFPLSGLTALAHDNTEPQQTKCEPVPSPAPIPPQRKPYLKGHSSARTRNQIPIRSGRPRQTEREITNTTSSSDQSPPDTPLDYTPVRLHTPPTPTALEAMNNSTVTVTLASSPSGSLRPPVSRSSCYNMRQICQNLRAERQRQSLHCLEPSVDLDPRPGRNQHRPTQLQRRGALLFRQADGTNLPASTNCTRLGTAPTQTLRTEICTTPISGSKAPLALSQPHLARYPHMADSNGKPSPRSLSSVNLRECSAYEIPWQIYRPTSALAICPAHVPYWKEVLWQWRNQRHDCREISALRMPMGHNLRVPPDDPSSTDP